MDDDELDDDSLDSAARLVGGSFCGRPYPSNVSAVSNMGMQTDYTDDDECSTSMCIECFATIAGAATQTGGVNVLDWQTLARGQLGKFGPEDAMRLAPIAEAAAKKAIKMYANPGVLARIKTVAEDIKGGGVITPDHPSLAFPTAPATPDFDSSASMNATQLSSGRRWTAMDVRHPM